MAVSKGIIEGTDGEIGTIKLVDGVAVPDEGAAAFLLDYDVVDNDGNVQELSDGPRFLAWLAIRVSGAYCWVRLEE